MQYNTSTIGSPSKLLELKSFNVILQLIVFFSGFSFIFVPCLIDNQYL